MGVNIVWWGWPKIKQGEDHGIAMYKEFFPEGPDFAYHYDIRTAPKGEGAVLVINSCISEMTAGAFGIVTPTLAAIQEYIQQMPWVILLIAQDEDAHTRFDTLTHPKMKIWVQCPKPPRTSTHPGLDWAAQCNSVRRLPMGYDSDFSSLALPSFQPNFQSRPIDWLFKGECALDRHGEWLTSLQRLAGHPQPLITKRCTFLKYEGREAECREDGYAPIDEYIRLHTSAKVVICRPEGWNPCPARLFYVLQAGCVPIVSEKPSMPGAWYDLYDWNNWWEYMLGEKPPFPVVKDIKDLEWTLQQALNEWPENGKRIYSWWIDYKKRLGESLRAEIREISQ